MKSIEGVCEAVWGWEDDFLRFGEENFVGISELVVKAAGTDKTVADAATANVLSAFAFGWKREIDGYRQKTGRRYPPLYKVKIVVEAEELPEEDSEAFYAKKQAEMHERAHAGG